MSNGTISAVANSAALGYGRDTGSVAPAKPVAGSAEATANVASTTVASAAAAGAVQPTQPVSPVQPVETEVSAEDMAEAVNQIRAYVKQVVPELDFSIDRDTGRVVVKVMDTEKNEVLRQIPSEEMLHVAKMLDKLQGLLFRDRA